MRILSWNIQQGGSSRLTAIANTLLRLDPDVIALSEFHSASSAQLLTAMSKAGWPHHALAPAPRNANAVCLVSRLPLTISTPAQREPLMDPRWLEARIDGLGLTAVHIPNQGERGSANKKQFWTSLLASAPHLILGDFNTGKHLLDGPGRPLSCAACMDHLEAQGWTDAWRHFHGSKSEGTWTSTIGNPFRLDHAFVSPTLLPRVRACAYSHHEREARLSDHSILLLDLEALA